VELRDGRRDALAEGLHEPVDGLPLLVGTLWRQGVARRQPGEFERVDWVSGTTFVPPNMVFHQHFNTGAEPALYLAIRWGSRKYRFLRPEGQRQDVSVNEGGDQIEFEDEDPEIYRMYAAECAKYGVKPDMERLFARAGRKAS
jgi:hypothetical protein